MKVKAQDRLGPTKSWQPLARVVGGRAHIPRNAGPDCGLLTTITVAKSPSNHLISSE
jgi:hypothetical protein